MRVHIQTFIGAIYSVLDIECLLISGRQEVYNIMTSHLSCRFKYSINQSQSDSRPESHLYPFIPQKVGMSTVVETTTKEVGGEIKGLADQNVDLVDTNARYAAYAARLRTALRASTRYVAYVC